MLVFCGGAESITIKNTIENTFDKSFHVYNIKVPRSIGISCVVDVHENGFVASLE